MAWIEKRGKTWHIKFRYSNRHFGKSLKTTSDREANASLARLEENLRLMERGVLELPQGADLTTFLLSDGKCANLSEVPVQITLEKLCSDF